MSELEKGFGTGLRAQLQKKLDPAAEPEVIEAPPEAVVADEFVTPAAFDISLDVRAGDPEVEELRAAVAATSAHAETVRAELDAVRRELEAAVGREQELREALQHQIEAYERELEAAREVAVREAQVGLQSDRLAAAESELEARERALSSQLEEREEELRAELEARELQLEARRVSLEDAERAVSCRESELVAEEARVNELSTRVESKVEEFESADRDRAEASAELAKQLAAIGEREKELKRERQWFDDHQREAEARVKTRQRETEGRLDARQQELRERDGELRRRDDELAERERAARELEAEAARERARVEARDEALARSESRLLDQERELETRVDARARELDERFQSRTRELDERVTARERELEERITAREQVVADGEQSMQEWESRLRVQAERLDRERAGHGRASQEAFALLAELEQREAGLVQREAELHEAQTALQARLETAATPSPELVARGEELDRREELLVAREAELNLRLATVAREDRDSDLVDKLREELRSREQEVVAQEGLVDSQRERIDARERRLAKMEQDLHNRSEAAARAEQDLRVREARLEADIELREDKLEEQARELAAREVRIGEREHDLAGYVGELQTKFHEREVDWWTKQLGHAPDLATRPQ